MAKNKDEWDRTLGLFSKQRPTLVEEVRDLKVLVGELIKRVGFLRCEVREIKDLIQEDKP